MSLQFAIVFADKYLAAQKEEVNTSFGNLYLKLMIAKKDFGKAEAFLENHGSVFHLWLEKAVWQLRIKYAKGQIEETMNQLEAMILQNYEMKDNEFQSMYYLHEFLITLAVKES